MYCCVAGCTIPDGVKEHNAAFGTLGALNLIM